MVWSRMTQKGHVLPNSDRGMSGRKAPIPAVHGTAIEPPGSAHRGLSSYSGQSHFPLPPGRRVKRPCPLVPPSPARRLYEPNSQVRPKTKGQRQSSQTAARRTKKIYLVRGTKRLQSVVLISVIQTRFTFQNSGPVNSNFPARLLR
jgi:hypothetical protein